MASMLTWFKVVNLGGDKSFEDIFLPMVVLSAVFWGRAKIIMIIDLIP